MIGCRGSTALVATIVLLTTGAAQAGTITITPAAVWIEHGDLVLRYDPDLRAKVYLKDPAGNLSINRSEGESIPATHSAVANGRAISGWTGDLSRAREEAVNNAFGRGRAVIIEAAAADRPDLKLRLELGLYDNFPSVLVTRATYSNQGREAVQLDRIEELAFRLDASLATSGAAPWDFYSFQGGAYRWGLDYACIPLDRDFYQENYMGQKPGQTGGGTPLVDLWTRRMGLALAELTPEPRLVALPVRAEVDGSVGVAIVDSVKTTLRPGGSHQGAYNALMVHRLDYYDALRNYSLLQEAQGLTHKKPPAEAYQIPWCTWGFMRGLSVKAIYDQLPRLKKLGIKAVTIDDGWQSSFGYWKPNPEVFPGGDADVARLVDRLHKEGFKARLWWAPFAAHENDQLAADHPEWFILDKAGERVRGGWGSYYLCPANQEVREYYRQLTTKWIKEYGFDGWKIDGNFMNCAPLCYNPAHKHASPDESYRATPGYLKVIYETATAIKPNFVIKICPCGLSPTFFYSPHYNLPVTADPAPFFRPQGDRQSRVRAKALKAYFGPGSPVHMDYVEWTTMGSVLKRHWPSQIALGGVLATMFSTVSEKYGDWYAVDDPRPRDQIPQLNSRITSADLAEYQFWCDLYYREAVYEGEYQNLYDVAFDRPEAHAVKKGNTMYYCFFAPSFDGSYPFPSRGTEVELRGLEAREYDVIDVVSGTRLGRVKGPTAAIDPQWTDYLFVKCLPR